MSSEIAFFRKQITKLVGGLEESSSFAPVALESVSSDEEVEDEVREGEGDNVFSSRKVIRHRAYKHVVA